MGIIDGLGYFLTLTMKKVGCFDVNFVILTVLALNLTLIYEIRDGLSNVEFE
jgi:hypothetical protein